MKLAILVTYFLSAATALESARLEDRPRSTRKRISRPSTTAGVKMRMSEYSVSTGIPTELRSKAALTRVPGLQRRGEGAEAIKMLSRQEPKASDFFECTNTVSCHSPRLGIASLTILHHPLAARLTCTRSQAPPQPTARWSWTKSCRPTMS